MSGPSTDRLHGLDALRGGALLLGVVLHASLSFMPEQIWITADASRSVGAAWLFFAIHLFRMTVFFLIAGLFAHLMIVRRGGLGFAKDRAVRITGPLLVFWFPVMAGIVTALIWNAYVNGMVTPGAPAPPPPTYNWTNFPLTHLWFLYVLSLFCLSALILRAPFAALDRQGGWGRSVDRVTDSLTGWHTPLILAGPLAAALWLDPAWVAFFAVPTPDAGVIPNAAALIGFGLAFGMGFFIDRRRDLLDRIARAWPAYLLLAVATGVWGYVLSGGPVLTPRVEPTAAKALAAGVIAVAVYASAFATLSLCLRFVSSQSPVRRYLADSSYWVYILHLPLVMLAQVWVQHWAGPWWLKLGGLSLGVLGACLLTYELMIRHTFMGRWLNGRRVPWRRTAQSIPAAAE